jgi:hypothetical protein
MMIRTCVTASCLMLVLGCEGQLVVDAGAAGGSPGADSGAPGTDVTPDAGASDPADAGSLDPGPFDAGPGLDGQSSYDPMIPLGQGWAHNDPRCPPDAAEVQGACDQEGLLCAYWGRDVRNSANVYTACGCWPLSRDRVEWYCYEQVKTEDACPVDEPNDGDDCFGLLGVECPYLPRTSCRCKDQSAPAWQKLTSPEPIPPELAAEFDTTKAISALNDAERQALCEWYVSAYALPGYPPPLDSPVSPDGYTVDNGATAGWGPVCRGCTPVISKAQCVGNLGLSSCSAPVSELVDCVLTIRSACWPSPSGCGRYLDTPGCSGTIVASDSGHYAVGTCSIRVQ